MAMAMAMEKAQKRLVLVLFAAASMYLAFLLLLELPFLSAPTPGDAGGTAGAGGVSGGGGSAVSSRLSALLQSEGSGYTPPRPVKRAYKPSPLISALDFRLSETANYSALEKWVNDAFSLGRTLLGELPPAPRAPAPSPLEESTAPATAACPASVAISGDEFVKMGSNIIELPCGLAVGSHITVVGTPRFAREEFDPVDGEGSRLVSQFAVELQGIKAVDGEAPPKVLRFNPILRGDSSGQPVIEMNTCYRMQWDRPLRCEGWRSHSDELTVDGQPRCARWARDDDGGATWLRRLVGVGKFPLEEGKPFVLTLSVGREGYRISIDDRHVSSFPYGIGYGAKDVAGFSLAGDLDVQSIFVAGLPSSNPSVAPLRQLELSPRWKAPPLPSGEEPVELFIGILSASNHFAERMAVRKSWINAVRRSHGRVVARFFVALSVRKTVNELLKQEAEYFGDIVIVPFVDHYYLVVMKTIAICEYGARVVNAKHVMKCDDDTFVRIDMVMKQINKIPNGRSYYIGNLNYFPKPLRHGKWAASMEEWSEEYYPTYAHGPGYIISSDIAGYIASEFEGGTLRLYKLEDVGMGLWVSEFNAGRRRVEYSHNPNFRQWGCNAGYFTAHYQSPRQMTCLWDKLQRSGKAQCCKATAVADSFFDLFFCRHRHRRLPAAVLKLTGWQCR